MRCGRTRSPLGFALLLAATFANAAAAFASASDVQQRACTALDARVDHAEGPRFLASYEGDALEPALRTAAFVYDNALATIALHACGNRSGAKTIGEALRLAATGDARMRNAYRAGPAASVPLPNGWWDAQQNRWLEDEYQAGSATGNVAWTALAMLALDTDSRDARWRSAAERLGQWIVANAADSNGDGFVGGIQGFDAPQPLRWKSTEHNIDLVALFSRLAQRSVPNAPWTKAAASARRFIDAQWNEKSGCFGVGLLPGGAPNRTGSGLDTQVWPQLLATANPDWRRAIDCAEREYAVDGGFDFNNDRDGLWLEGTAQAALLYRTLGRESAAVRMFATILSQLAPGGLVFATREARITTGLAIGPGSRSADFYYYRLPHLGTTAWAALAATGYDPFVPDGRLNSDRPRP